jgi:hypothetical protein
MSNDVRLSNYTFQLVNNKLRIFPIPSDEDMGHQLWFNYIKIEDRNNAAIGAGGNKINNVSKAPYNNITYAQINSLGRSWIFEYTLALSREMLGNIRSKYSTIPIPGADVTLNGAALVSSADADKIALTTRLREYFDQTSRQSLLERRAAETVARNSEISQVPMTIYIG